MFLVIIAIVIAIILCAVCHIMNFPGGPSGFAICTKMWIKERQLLFVATFLKVLISQFCDKQKASCSFHPRQKQEHSQSPSQHG